MICSRPTLRQRLQGGMIGLLVGDALGVPYEFLGPHRMPPIEQIDMVPPAGFRSLRPRILPGTWSDDGAQALCLLESLLEVGMLDTCDFAERLVRWYDNGHMAVDGVVFDVGITTEAALTRLKQGVPSQQAGLTGERDNGNGSLMRVLPLALWHKGTDSDLFRDACTQSLVTHGHLRSQIACALYCIWARFELFGVHDPWERAKASARLLCAGEDQRRELDSVLEGKPTGLGYVADSLISAYACCKHASYEAVVKSAVALGNDTDTTACLAGGVAGIRHGLHGIPAVWRSKLPLQSTDSPLRLLQRLLRHHGVLNPAVLIAASARGSVTSTSSSLIDSDRDPAFTHARLLEVASWASRTNADDLRVLRVRTHGLAEDGVADSQIANTFEELGALGEEIVVDGVSAFSNGKVADLLSPLGDAPLRVGLIGSCINGQLTFLAYDLRARYPDAEIAVCTELVGDGTQREFVESISQLDRSLQVNILFSVSEFIDFLGGSVVLTETAPASSDGAPRVEIVEPTLSAGDCRLVRRLFLRSRSVALRNIAGGYSGSLVLDAESRDVQGNHEARHVLKIGDTRVVRKELSGYHRIEPILGNSVPYLVDVVARQDRAAMKFRYAGLHDSHVETFSQVYASEAGDADIRRILQRLFLRILIRFYKNAVPMPGNLLHLFRFDERYRGYAEHWIERTIAANDGVSSCLKQLVPALTAFYHAMGDRSADRLPGATCVVPQSQVHGDLNGSNILVDEGRNVWLVDFAHHRTGYVLDDLIRLESDLLFVSTKLANDTELHEAFRISDSLLAITDVTGPPPTIDALSSQRLRRLYSTIVELRSYYCTFVHGYAHPAALLAGQVRYALDALGYSTACTNDRQKAWALYVAGIGARRLMGYLA